jgi:hypothetical protein
MGTVKPTVHLEPQDTGRGLAWAIVFGIGAGFAILVTLFALSGLWVEFSR